MSELFNKNLRIRSSKSQKSRGLEESCRNSFLEI